MSIKNIKSLLRINESEGTIFKSLGELADYMSESGKQGYIFIWEDGVFTNQIRVTLRDDSEIPVGDLSELLNQKFPNSGKFYTDYPATYKVVNFKLYIRNSKIKLVDY